MSVKSKEDCFFATERQAGGKDHYMRGTIQPIQYIAANDLCFFAGNIVKYATRAPFKGQFKSDIQKIIHYAELWLEAFEKGEVRVEG